MQTRLLLTSIVLFAAVLAVPLHAACTPPTPEITFGQPQVCQGNSGTASVVPDPDPSAVYLWTITPSGAGEVTAGGASPTVTFIPYSVGQPTLNVTVSNSCGMATASRQISVGVVPGTELPFDVFGMPGQQVTIHTIEHESLPTSYQWYRGMRGDTSAPIGTNEPSVTVTTPASDTYYWVRVENQCGGVNTNQVRLHACNYPVPQPAINTREFACTNNIFTISTPADPDPSATYEWRYLPSLACDHFPTPEIGPNGNTATVRLRSGVAFCGAQLILTITNSCYSASTQAHVTEDQPVDFNIVAPSAVRRGQLATARTEGPVFQDWQRPIFNPPGPQASDTTVHWTISGGVIVEGEDSRTVSFISDSALVTLSASVGNSCGAANRSVTISACQPPVISAEPASRVILAGSPVTLTANTEGATPLSYEWYIVGPGDVHTPVGGNTRSLTDRPAGTTTYLVRTQTSCGPPLDSEPVTVTVTLTPCDPVAITTQPADQFVAAGSPARLHVEFEGTLPVTIQWYAGSSGDTAHPLAGQIFATLAVTAAQSGPYWARITSRCGSADSRTAQVTIVTPRHRAARH
jgi:hypothetical protein